MKCIMVMFDTLNRRSLGAYGCRDFPTPNFDRLAAKSVTFETSYVCSMPCIPARRDLHTGRPNFLHRSWGPLEPFDDSMPRMLRDAGVHSALITDHQHYFEEGGGGTYHNMYSSWQFHRGQEGDPFWGQVAPEPPAGYAGTNAQSGFYATQDRVNRKFLTREEDQPQYKTFAGGLDFIERNAAEDGWFLHIETFDPHEPFFTQPSYQTAFRHLIGDRARSPLCDWPSYGQCSLSPDLQNQMRGHYNALITMCDRHLGKVLDAMDRHQLWEDTMLIVWTDHGFLLGEHEQWGKTVTPYYDEIAKTPFFVWDPREKIAGARRRALVQPSIDLAPTVLDFFGLPPATTMTGKNLRPVVASDTTVREAAIFGAHGAFLNITDGRHVLMQAPDPTAGPTFEYTLMPTHMHGFFSNEELAAAELAGPFNFTKGLPLLRCPKANKAFEPNRGLNFEGSSALFDTEIDPGQTNPVEAPETGAALLRAASAIARETDAPADIFPRFHLP